MLYHASKYLAIHNHQVQRFTRRKTSALLAQGIWASSQADNSDVFGIRFGGIRFRKRTASSLVLLLLMHQLSNTIGQHDDIGVSLPNLSPLGSNINLYALYDIYVFF